MFWENISLRVWKTIHTISDAHVIPQGYPHLSANLFIVYVHSSMLFRYGVFVVWACYVLEALVVYYYRVVGWLVIHCDPYIDRD